MALRKLSPREQRTLAAAAECILPAGGPFPLGHADVDYQAFVQDEFLAAVPREVAQLAHLILFFVEYVLGFYLWRPGRFSKMPLDRRNRAFDAMRHSRLFFVRGFFILLSSMLLMPFYKDEKVMDAIGYGGYKPGVNKAQEPA
jgi:hypothetical protein